MPYGKYASLLIPPFAVVQPEHESAPRVICGDITIKQVNCFFVSEIFYISVTGITLFTLC